jgi:hypothetical protein
MTASRRLLLLAEERPRGAGWGQLTEGKDLGALVPWLLAGVAVWLGFVASLFFLARDSVGKDEWRP